MSDYHRIYIKLKDLIERGHCVQFEKVFDDKVEVTVFEARWSKDHFHTSDELLSEVMDKALRMALDRWPKEDD